MPSIFDFDNVMEERTKAVTASIDRISIEKLKELGEKLFPILDHPWRAVYFEFLDANPAEAFYHAAAGEGVEIIYCAGKEQGIWYVPKSGVGPLQARGLKILKDIVKKKR